MKKHLKTLIIGIIVLISAIAFYGCGDQPDQDDLTDEESTNGKIQISSTIFPIYDISRNIGGEFVEAGYILSPGASPHTFEPSPSNIKNLQGTKIIFSVGYGLDNWTDTLTRTIEDVENIEVSHNIELYPFSFEHKHHDHERDGREYEEHDEHDEQDDEHEHDQDHTHDHGNEDPHYWLNTENAKVIAENIADALIKHDPENESAYIQNLNAYKQELDLLHNKINEKLGELENKNLIVFHDSWSYFAREFQLNVVGIFEASPGKTPTPKYLEELYRKAEEYNLKALFSEPQLSPASLKPFVEDLSLELYVLDPLGGLQERDSYVKMMRYNADTIYGALKE